MEMLEEGTIFENYMLYFFLIGYDTSSVLPNKDLLIIIDESMKLVNGSFII
jgi:hypothetical protein